MSIIGILHNILIFIKTIKTIITLINAIRIKSVRAQRSINQRALVEMINKEMALTKNTCKLRCHWFFEIAFLLVSSEWILCDETSGNHR